MHISAHLIESYPSEYGSWSWAKEKFSIPLEAHDKAQLSEVFQVFFQKFKELYFFYLLAHPAETAYLSFEIESFLTTYGLSNCGEDKWKFTPFCGWSQATAFVPELSKAITFFVLRRILVKFHIRTRLIGSFPSTYWSWSCAEEKLHFTPVHTLCQMKRGEGLFPPLLISLAGRNGLKNLPRQIFSACVKFGGNPCGGVETA